MNRPKYETAKNRKAEAEVLSSVKHIVEGRGWGRLEKNPELSRIDYFSWDGKKRLGAYEIKDRPGIDFDKQWPVFLSTEKANTMIRHDRNDTPCFFIIRDKNRRIRWARITLDHVLSYLMKWGGRTDRKDPLDEELLFLIPAKDWFPIEDFPKRGE